MRTALRIIAGVAAIIGAVVVAVVVAVFVATQTDFGRDRVRQLALSAARKAIHGRVEIGRISGNLLAHPTLDSLSITDSSGAPFLSVRRASLHYGLANMVHQRLYLRQVELDDPVVVLNQSPTGTWNFARLFPSSNTPSDTTKHGFGDWIMIRGLRLVNARVVLERPYTPDSTSAHSRLVIVKTPTGYAQVTTVDRLNAELPLVRIADPADKTKLAEIAWLNADVAPFQPPIARIDDLAATVHLDNDSLWLRGARLAMPGSRIDSISVRYGLKATDLALTLHAAPVAFGAARFAYPPLPTDGTVAARVGVRWRGRSQDYGVRDIDLNTGTARAVGQIYAHVGDSMAVHDTRLTFSGVDTRLIEQLAPTVHVPREGIASGHLSADGTIHDATVNADLAFDDARAGLSHLGAVGTIGLDSSARGRDLHARHLVLTLDQVRVALARTFVKTLPVGGAVSGTIDLDGSTRTALTADADLTHVERGQESHVTATANAEFEGRPRDHPWIDVNATLDPLSLTTAGRFAPAAGLHNAIVGTTRVTGDLGDLTLHSHLIIAGPTVAPPTPLPIVSPALPIDTMPAPVIKSGQAPGTTLSQAVAAGEVTPAEISNGRLQPGTRAPQAPRYSLYPGNLGAPTHDTVVAVGDTAGLIVVDGRMDLASKTKRYDLAARAYLFNANAVSTKAPATAITATAGAKGSGTDPKTMQATVYANLAGSVIDSVAVDSLVLRGSIASGLAHVDTAHMRLRAASADVTGTLGMSPETTGQLTYFLTLDSLAALRRFMGPSDTGSFRPGPGRLSKAYARARGDTGAMTPERQLAMDTAAMRRDLLSGRVHAAGVVTGSMQRFNLRGRVAGTDLIFHGNSVQRLRAEYAWLDGPSLTSPLILGAQLDTVSIGTFALDSIDARVTYQKPKGTVMFLVRQRGIPEEPGGPPTHDQEYTANLDFAFKPEDRRLQFNAMSLQFDTTYWTSPAAPAPPTVVEWGARGVALHGLNLSNGHGGTIVADADIPKSGPLKAHAAIQHLHLGEVIALVESRLVARGDLSTTVDVAGTSHRPTVNGSLTFADGTYNGIPVPDVRTTFQYDTTLLQAHLDLATNIGPSPGRVFETADGYLPIDLALDHDTTSRIPKDGPLALHVKADSMPLELIPQLVTTVQDVHGLGKAKLDVSGTISKPVANGAITLVNGTALIVPANIRLEDLAGAIRITPDSLVVDSLVAASEGTIKITGSVDLTDPEALPVDVSEVASGFRILNSKQYGWAVIDDSLTFGGSLRALSLSRPAARLVLGGTIDLTDGVFYAPETGVPIPIDLGDPAVYKVADTTDQATKALIPQPQTLTTRLLLTGVDISIEPQVWVRNKEANVEIYTDDPLTLRIDDRRSHLALDGVVATERGQYTFLSKRFQITKGTAQFIGSQTLNPSVQATALYPVTVPGREPVNIQIDIGGTAQAPTVKLTSDAQPPLSQSDLISYLAFGSSSASVLSSSSSGGGGTGAGAAGLPIGEAAAYVQQQLASVAIGTFTESLQGDIARSLDADVFNITNNSNTPIQFSQAGAQNFLASTRLEFGKYWDPQTYFAVQASPLSWTVSPPGALVQRRLGQRTSVVATFQPYFLLQQPSLTPLSTSSGITPTPVFGLFLLRDWRW